MPNGAVLGDGLVYLVDEAASTLVEVQADVVSRGPKESLVRIPDADGRLLAVAGLEAAAHGSEVALRN